MNNIKHNLTKKLVAAAAVVALFAPLAASAQDVSYNDGEQIQGTVTSINGAWNITVADSNGYTDSIALHQGTIINPTGLTLEPGMNVTIDGYGDGDNFDAMQIDTPYQYNGPAPTAVYYGPGDWYPGYAAGWGPSFTLAFDLNTRRYVQRSYYVGGQVRRPVTPPSGWQNVRTASSATPASSVRNSTRRTFRNAAAAAATPATAAAFIRTAAAATAIRRSAADAAAHVQRPAPSGTAASVCLTATATAARPVHCAATAIGSAATAAAALRAARERGRFTTAPTRRFVAGLTRQ